jgi:uncharacterized protein (DUF302 family)
MPAAELPAGFVRIASLHGAAETIDRLEAAARQHGLIVFARIDFAADAERAGLAMRPEQLLLFGNPRAGTPLMLAAPSTGLDLPMKALAWQDADGKTWVAYNPPEWIAQRHGLSPELAANLAGAVALIEQAAQ